MIFGVGRKGDYDGSTIVDIRAVFGGHIIISIFMILSVRALAASILKMPAEVKRKRSFSGKYRISMDRKMGETLGIGL